VRESPGGTDRPQGEKHAGGDSASNVEVARKRLALGYTRLPNSILMAIVGGEFTKGEVKLLLLIARMTISFNRPLVPLSKTAIERIVGAHVVARFSGPA
jgi:hypothetical protein